MRLSPTLSLLLVSISLPSTMAAGPASRSVASEETSADDTLSRRSHLPLPLDRSALGRRRPFGAVDLDAKWLEDLDEPATTRRRLAREERLLERRQLGTVESAVGGLFGTTSSATNEVAATSAAMDVDGGVSTATDSVSFQTTGLATAPTTTSSAVVTSSPLADALSSVVAPVDSLVSTVVSDGLSTSYASATALDTASIAATASSSTADSTLLSSVSTPDASTQTAEASSTIVSTGLLTANGIQSASATTAVSSADTTTSAVAEKASSTATTNAHGATVTLYSTAKAQTSTSNAGSNSSKPTALSDTQSGASPLSSYTSLDSLLLLFTSIVATAFVA